MRNTLILLVLISLGLAAPALAAERHGGWAHRDEPRVEREHRSSVRQKRGDDYRHFRQRMQGLRKDLRHERRENQRWERRNAHRSYAPPAPAVVAPRPLLLPRIVVHLPFGW